MARGTKPGKYRMSGVKKQATSKRSPKPKSKKRASGPGKIYQLKVVLLDIEPPVWRRFLVPESVKLHQLHQILQIVMGWEDCHLHQFVSAAEIFADPETEPDGEMGEMKSEHRYLLREILPGESSSITYEYDFGDRWKHWVQVEKIFPAGEVSTESLLCLEGDRACPPEDCGGVHGYAEVLDIIFNPSHPDYEAMVRWTGKDFNPEIFDIHRVNARLKGVKIRKA